MGDEKKILQKLDEVAQQAGANPAFARMLSGMAIDAILSGVSSPQWTAYMQVIVGADSPKQLARLTFKDSHHDDPWLKRSNVYIVSNAVCGTGTTTHTGDRVDPLIDQPFDD